MAAYGYSPSSFKNFITDPVRAKAVPSVYKLEILLNALRENQIEKVFTYAHGLVNQSQETNVLLSRHDRNTVSLPWKAHSNRKASLETR